MSSAEQRMTSTGLTILITAFLILPIIAVIPDVSSSVPTRYAPRKNLSKVVPYHQYSNEEYSGEACIQMLFDYWGPSIDQQDIRNVTKSALGSGVTQPKEVIRAIHFSDQSLARGNQRGYNERPFGYGAFSYDWTSDQRNPSSRYEQRFTDLFEALDRNFPVMVFMYKDIPPELNPQPPDTPQPPDPSDPDVPEPTVTPADLAALEKVWRLVVGYDANNEGARFTIHDPLPKGTGFIGGKGKTISESNFDKLWNIYTQADDLTFGTHRIGITGAPWKIGDLKAPRKAQAGTDFEIQANITYKAPPIMQGDPVQNPTATMEIPPDFSMASGSQEVQLDISEPRTYHEIVWNIRAPDRTYAGQDYGFMINATGTVRVTETPRHIDRIGDSISFEVESFGYLNHPPTISSASVEPDYIPDDGSEQPLFTCTVSDQDGDLDEVTADLSDVGGSPTQNLNDDGRYGDEAEDDGVYSFRYRETMPVGEWTIKITAVDFPEGAKDTANVTIKVDPSAMFTEPPEFLDAGMYPPEIPNDGFTPSTIWATIEDEENDLRSVKADLTPVGGEDDEDLNDEGEEGDLFENDGNWSMEITVPQTVEIGPYQVKITALDDAGHEEEKMVWVEVVIPPVAPMITDVSPEPETVVNDGETEVVLTAIVEDQNEDLEKVWADLTPVGGSSNSEMNDDGIGADRTADDGIWSLDFTVPSTVSPGKKGRIDVTAEDRTGLTGTNFFSLTVEQANSAPVILDYSVSSYEISPGDTVIVTANLTDPDNDILQVEVGLVELNISDLTLKDDGEEPDETAGDMTFSGQFVVPDDISEGEYNITLRVRDPSGEEISSIILLTVKGTDQDDSATSDMDMLVYIGAPIGGGLILVLLFIVLFFYFRKQKAQGQFGPAGPGGVRGPMGGNKPFPGRGAPGAGRPQFRPVR